VSRYGVDVLRPVDLAHDAPDPVDALRRAERLADALAQAAADSGLHLDELDAPATTVATVACQRAPYLATLLARDPARLARVAADLYLTRDEPRDVLAAELGARVAAARPPADLRTALRQVHADELVRPGVRELAQGRDVEVGRELARLADACFDAAIGFHDAALRARHGVPTCINDDGTTWGAHGTLRHEAPQHGQALGRSHAPGGL